jgi:hypothetical protein
MIGFKPGMIGMVACAAIGCTTVKTDQDPNANFQKYRTYAVTNTRVVTNGEVAEPEALVTDRVTSAIQSELLTTGLHPAQPHERPDLLVAFSTRNQTPRQINAYWARGSGYNASKAPGAGEVIWTDDKTPQGTLVIDFMDAYTKKLVFRTVARLDDDQLIDTDIIEHAVDKALKDFPRS